MLISKKKALNIRLPTPQTLKERRMSKERTPQLNVEVFSNDAFASKLPLSFGLKQLQPHAILRTDQSSYRLMERWCITSLMTGNL
ncbi:hypothetical protein Tco_0664638 [Tanacetum coccineum]